ncbi:MAG TPA: glycoside hydrolase domain-containing protein [Conexibacter sp.]|nr:glycoside hydrolase domain-containing protein [Conexibacter sp.]
MRAFQGLDRAAAPPAAKAKQMLDAIGGRWWNVYIGGPESGGSGWTPDLVRDYVRHGIDRFMLTYVGQQHGGTLTAAQGRHDGAEALAIARRFGYRGSVPLCLDVEMGTFNGAPSATVQYTRAWCETVRRAGARPGVYANPAPLQAMAKGGVRADFVWVASWVGSQRSDRDPHAIASMPNDLWSKPGQRAWQYAGALKNAPCRVLGLDVDVSVADLGCLAPPPGAVAAAAARLDTGAHGAAVVRLTHRLSIVPSPTTGRPYLDGPRRRFDAATHDALRAFQREHGLPATGTYERASARALLRAAKAAGRHREHAAPHVEPASAARAHTRLPQLAREFERLDAAANQAWQRLEAYAGKRRRGVARAAAENDGLDEIADTLGRIEHQLGKLVELEAREVELAEHTPDATHAAVEAAVAASADQPAAAPRSAPTDAAQAPDARAAGDGANGARPSSPAPARRLAELDDAELDARIEQLDERLDRARRERIARWARAEKQLVRHERASRASSPGRSPGASTRPHHRRRPHAPAPARPVPPRGHERLAAEEVRRLQRSLNRFTERALRHVPPLEVDGKQGTETNRRIELAKFYLGYGGAERTAVLTPIFLRRLEHPRSARYSGPRMLTRAARRRRRQRHDAARLGRGPIEGTPKHIVDAIVLPIAAACGIHVSPATIAVWNARHGPTSSGLRSDHQGPPDVAWAADLSNGSSPTPQMDELARRLAHRLDIPWNGAGVVNASHNGYRFQLIYRAPDHYNHVHIGIKAL